MRFSTATSIALLSALASAKVSTVELFAESSQGDVNGQGISPKHEGAGINYLFLGGNAAQLTYDDETQELAQSEGSFSAAFNIQGNIPELSVLGVDKVTFEGGYLAVNGSTDDFYAQKNIQEPYQYSQSSYAVVYYKSGAPSDAIPIKIKTSGGDAPSSSAAPTSSAHYSNGTVTTHETETVFTTYCPEETTIVVVTCHETKCEPHSVTVSTPGTVTITGSPVTPSPAAPTTAKPAPPAPSTAATSAAKPSSQAPAVTTAVNGAGSNAVAGSLLFAAGVAGLLI